MISYAFRVWDFFIAKINFAAMEWSMAVYFLYQGGIL